MTCILLIFPQPYIAKYLKDKFDGHCKPETNTNNLEGKLNNTMITSINDIKHEQKSCGDASTIFSVCPKDQSNSPVFYTILVMTFFGFGSLCSCINFITVRVLQLVAHENQKTTLRRNELMKNRSKKNTIRRHEDA